MTDVERLVTELRKVDGCRFYEPVPAAILDQWEREFGVGFPSEYREFLMLTNGCETYHGHYRIFGFALQRSIDIVKWNSEECWKFAWNGVADGYWCFGETALGDQYAFAIDDLHTTDRPPVLMLDHMSMTHDGPWQDCFASFLERELLRNAKQPYGSEYRRAFDTLGPIDLSIHAVLIPSLLFLPAGDDGRRSAIQAMPARAAMICNGDLAVQWDSAPDGARVHNVEPYVDDQDRSRMRIRWADPDGV